MNTFHLTPEEFSLVKQSDWILTKNRVIDKGYALFGELQRQLSLLPVIASFDFPEHCLRNGAKISRGEKYLGLPYLMLDYPRLFTRDSVFAYRVMFWWGHFFSCTLHLSGQAKKQYAPALKNHFQHLKQHRFFISVNEEEWSHHFEADNYRPLENISAGNFQQLLDEKAFIKISCQFPLDSWENIIPSALQSLEILLESLQT